ncbi:MAG: phosphate signaling complex protein PhoU [Caldilineaceae bacterium]|nr:phosphate signaling complex protein PhoU [Caldilineaceae bacterium]
MARAQFHQDLQNLQDELLLMASMASQAVRGSVRALKELDDELAGEIIMGDREINGKRMGIEDTCLTLIATQQPMARDMRLLAGVLEISGELERIGDYGKGICRIVLMMGGRPHIKPLIDIPRMADIALDMLDKAMEAFINNDAAAAGMIPAMDDEVDGLYNQIYSELLTLLASHPSEVEQSNRLLWAAHNLERCADRSINICERVIYTVTGEYRELDDMTELGYSGIH